jgi:hypothetical protein
LGAWEDLDGIWMGFSCFMGFSIGFSRFGWVDGIFRWKFHAGEKHCGEKVYWYFEKMFDGIWEVSV